MTEPFVNKVAESGIVSIDLEQFYPAGDVVTFDLKEHLFMGLILKEKEFRQALKELDLSAFQNKIVAVTCSADAIIPMWAYMLVIVALKRVSISVMYGDATTVIQKILIENIRAIQPETYADKRVVVKGCGEKKISEEAYLTITDKLLPYVQSIMYGEPCSTVPVYKRKTTTSGD
jgi:hypothetical protein